MQVLPESFDAVVVRAVGGQEVQLDPGHVQERTAGLAAAVDAVVVEVSPPVQEGSHRLVRDKDQHRCFVWRCGESAT
jgi:hypothetical protein